VNVKVYFYELYWRVSIFDMFVVFIFKAQVHTGLFTSDFLVLLAAKKLLGTDIESWDG
jgi:hypothetical protein